MACVDFKKANCQLSSQLTIKKTPTTPHTLQHMNRQSFFSLPQKIGTNHKHFNLHRNGLCFFTKTKIKLSAKIAESFNLYKFSIRYILLQSLENCNCTCNCCTNHWIITHTDKTHHLNVSRN